MGPYIASWCMLVATQTKAWLESWSFQSHTLTSEVGRGAANWVQSIMGNYLFHHVYTMKLLQNPQMLVFESFQIGKQI